MRRLFKKNPLTAKHAKKRKVHKDIILYFSSLRSLV